MNLLSGDEKTKKFVTNVGLITSSGPHGDNIMSAEWTHQASYSPGIIIISIGNKKATLENIKKTKEFGVSLAAVDQIVIASVAGKTSGREFDKIKALKEIGCSFYKANKIKALMVDGAVH